MQVQSMRSANDITELTLLVDIPLPSDLFTYLVSRLEREVMVRKYTRGSPEISGSNYCICNKKGATMSNIFIDPFIS